MTKRNEHEADRKHSERLEKITAASHAALAEPNDDPAAAGFAAAKADNLIQGRVRDRRAAEDRGEALAKKIHENCHDQLTPSEQADLLAYLRCGR